MLRHMRIRKPLWLFDAGSWRIGLHFDTIHMAGSRCYALGVYVPMLTCVFTVTAP